VVVAIYATTGAVYAADTLVYGFEDGLQGFGPNGAITVSHETTIGVTEGDNSMKVDVVGGFVGALTPNLHPAIGDPPGLDHVTFDLTLTQEYAGTFAVVGVMVFGVNQQGSPVQLQTGPDFDPELDPVLEYHLEDLAPGTYTDITIDMTEFIHPVTFELGTFNDIVGTQGSGPNDMIPTSFQLYFNKNPGTALIVYIDNIRVGMTVEGLPGDFNEDEVVDAADFVYWRKAADAGLDDLPNDNDDTGPVGAAEYSLWQTNFASMSGGGSSGAVPEPASAALLTVIVFCFWGAKRSTGW
jgi:hypothetical protein